MSEPTQMNWKRYLVDWIGVSVKRAAEAVGIFWALLGIAAYQNWGGEQEWSDYFIPLSSVSLLALAFFLAVRRSELTDKFD